MEKIPNEMKKIKLYDGRPAYIFADSKTGKFPMNEFCCDRKTCPYCGEKLKNDECDCYTYKRVKHYNDSLDG